MLVNQSVNHNNSERFQQQIAVGETKIARVMGPTVVRDVAIIGFDPYMINGKYVSFGCPSVRLALRC